MSKFNLTIPDHVSIDITGGGRVFELALLTQVQHAPLYVLKAGIKGDKGDSGRMTYRVNFTNQQTVQVNHDIGTYPIPMVFNANDEIVLISPKHINQNRFDLIFNEPISGYVIY